MSGGHFDYDQYKIDQIADSIETLIYNNDDETEDEYGWRRGRGYRPDTIAKFKEALDTCRRAAKMAHRIDWLVSGDDGEDTFHKRWQEDLEE